MKLKEIGEFGFIRRISPGCLIRPEGVHRAIGDDAAVFATSADTVALVTTDMLVERVHFLRDGIGGFDLGYKSLAVNLSDIAAMGGTAREAFVSIAIPADYPLDKLDDIYRGMKTLAAAFDVNILGGDTTGSLADLVINVAVYGQAPAAQVLYRNGAEAGDVLLATGVLGDSRAGLHLILNRLTADTPALEKLLAAHRHPEPHLQEGRFLATFGGVHAAIDVSDGLSADIAHILTESGTGAKIFADALPISDELKEFCARFGFDPVEVALAGGEDYVLLCTSAARTAGALALAFENSFKRPLFHIGEITAEGGLLLVRSDGSNAPIGMTGWDHFCPVSS